MKKSQYFWSSWRKYGDVDLTKSSVMAFALGLLFFLLLKQHAVVFNYNDDWGVAVLDYVVAIDGFQGQDFSLSQALAFVGGLYEQWSGRVVSIFIHVYLQKAGLWYVRCFQVITIMATVWLSYRTLTRQCQTSHSPALLLLSIILFLSIPESAKIDGFYWFSAASGYLWGIPLFLLGASLVFRQRNIGLTAALLLAMAGVFHELLGFAVLAFLGSHWLLNLKHLLVKERHWVRHLAYTVIPIIAVIATAFAPGNFNRMTVIEYAGTGMWDQILINMNTIHSEVFAFQSSYSVLLAFSLVVFLLQALRSRARLLARYLILLVILAVLSMLYMCSPVGFTLTFLALYGLSLLYCTPEKSDNSWLICIYLSALAALAPLLLSPAIFVRAIIPFYLLTFIPILYAAFLTMAELDKTWLGKLVRNGVIAALILVVFQDNNNTYQGYKENSQTHIINDAILRNTSLRQRNGSAITEPITLYKIPQSRYASRQPYERDLIQHWMKKYYRLPPDVEFVWE